jgi:hypothetical protein
VPDFSRLSPYEWTRLDSRQRFGKQQVVGSSPTVGSPENPEFKRLRAMAVGAAHYANHYANACVNPRQVRDFARAIGPLARTDRLDAQVLAQFAALLHPVPRPLPDAQAQELAALVGRRRDRALARCAWSGYSM